jgi:Pretoxin HINT domain
MHRTLRLANFVVAVSTVLTCGVPVWAATADLDSAKSTAAPPAAQCVRAAIAAEVRADRAERDRLIVEALRAAPDYAPARWQSGQVRYGDQWMTINAAVEKGGQDELLGQYRKLRSLYEKNPEGQLALARWCQKHHLAAETRAHASQLLPSRQNDPELLKMLDLTWHKGQLITVAELAQRKVQDEKAKEAMRHWRPLIGAIRNKIESKSAGERDEGLAQLKAIQDPAAIEALIVVCKNRPGLLCETLRVIGQIPGQEATDALLRQAVLTKDENVLLTACEQLKTRSVYGYVPKLMAALSTPLKTKLEVVDENDEIHFRETVEREQEGGTVGKSIDTEVKLLTPNPNLGNIIGQTYAETFLDTQATTKGAAKLNQKLKAFNDSIYRVLESTVGTNAPRDPVAWWDWWHSYNVLGLGPKPAYIDSYYNPVNVAYVPYAPADIPNYAVDTSFSWSVTSPPRHHSCFARGTTVWTLDGQMPIENVQVGDRVLSQNPLSGELTFKPVLQTTVGHQKFMALVTTNGERLVATAGHVFWVSGSGWRMTKEIEVGDRLHTISGWSEVKSHEPVEAGETRNLVVADFNTYFVGEDRVLTHDVTLPQTVTGGVPGEITYAAR